MLLCRGAFANEMSSPQRGSRVLTATLSLAAAVLVGRDV